VAYESDIHRNLVNEREVMSDLIKALKENEKPFGLMSEEMQDKAKKIGKDTKFERFYASQWNVVNGELFSTNATYRLHPDYEEKPEIVECEVKPPDTANMMWVDTSPLAERNAGSNTMDFCSCTMHPDFIGFKYEDGSIQSVPRSFKGERDGEIWGSVLSSEKLSDFKVLTPTHVVFKKKCGSAAPK